MESVYDFHVHYTFDVPLKEKVEIFKEEFDVTKTEKYCFLSLPHHAHGDGVSFDATQNVLGLFLKKTFSPNAYAFAGLEHPVTICDKNKVGEDFLNQAKTYMAVGFDGIKMLEGYPSLIRNWSLGVDDCVYDKFYAYMEENGFPIVMHIANPTENWDISKASANAMKEGRVYDDTYPTKNELIGQVFNVLKRFPKLKLTLAHFGFLSDDFKRAEEFLSYPNTSFDVTPGGEQLIKMSENWDLWLNFWQKNLRKIIYGTDFYPFPKDDKWQENFLRRPSFIRRFFETDQTHSYVDGDFKGVLLSKKMREKIYRENFIKILGEPKKISIEFLIDTASELLRSNRIKSDILIADLKYILENL